MVEVGQPSYSVEMWTNSTISRFKFILVPPYFSQFSQLPCALVSPNIPVLKHTMIFLFGKIPGTVFQKTWLLCFHWLLHKPYSQLITFPRSFSHCTYLLSHRKNGYTPAPSTAPRSSVPCSGGAVQLCLPWTHMDMLHLSHKHPLFSQAHFF